MLTRFRRRRLTPEQVEAASLQRLRYELAWWGVGTSALSDEELVAGVARMCRALRACGVTVAEACEAWATSPAREVLRRSAWPAPG